MALSDVDGHRDLDAHRDLVAFVTNRGNKAKVRLNNRSGVSAYV